MAGRGRAYVARCTDQLDDDGWRLVVCNSYHQSREVLTGAGAVGVKVPQVDDRRLALKPLRGSGFSRRSLPARPRESLQMSEVLPLLYRRGLSPSDFTPALEQFLGTGAGLSESTITRLTTQRYDEARAFAARALSRAPITSTCGSTAFTSR